MLMLFDTVWGAELILYHVIRVWSLLDCLDPVDSILENTIFLHLLESSILDVVLRELALDCSHGEQAFDDDILSLVFGFVKILPFGVRRISRNLLIDHVHVLLGCNDELLVQLGG